MPGPEDLTGKLYGRLTVKRFSHYSRTAYGASIRIWECSCGCGNPEKILLETRYLTKGSRWHCGCATAQKPSWAGSTEHKAWESIKERCYSSSHPAYKNYGGRGITLHEEWREDFPAFLAHVGPRPSKAHSIERKDNDIGYVPGNLAWATRKEQNRNRRSNRHLTLNGVTKTVAEWSEITGTNQSTITGRLSMGWSVAAALQTKTRSAAVLTYKGVSMTTLEWADHLGLTREALDFRIKQGWAEEDIFTPKGCPREIARHRARKLEFQGKSLTVSEWADELGIPIPTIKNRLRKGRPIHEILYKGSLLLNKF